MVQKLGLGYNEQGWSMEMVCEGADGILGCGAPIRITKDDVYKMTGAVAGKMIGVTPKNIAAVRCPCRAQTLVPRGYLFTNLPTEYEKLTRHPETP